MKCIILAAGMGRRLYPFTKAQPKPMMPVANRPLLHHALSKVQATGITDVLINLHYLPEKIQEHVDAGHSNGLRITCRIEERLTGPAGALLAFEEQVAGDECLLVLSGDGLHDVDLSGLIAFHRDRGASLTVVMKEMRNPGRYGVAELDEQNRIVSFVEKPPLPKDAYGWVSCGIYCIDPALLREFPRTELYDYGELVQKLIAEERPVYAMRTEAYWSDIGTPETLLEANLDALCARVALDLPGEKQAESLHVEAGAMIHPDAVIEGPVLIGQGSRILAGATLVGPVVIGANCTVGAHAHLQGTVLLAGAEIPDYGTVVGGLLGKVDHE